MTEDFAPQVETCRWCNTAPSVARVGGIDCCSGCKPTLDAQWERLKHLKPPSGHSHWRLRSRVVIREVMDRMKGQDPKEIRKAVSKAYPFGERSMWPYKLWLEEVRRAMKEVDGVDGNV